MKILNDEEKPWARQMLDRFLLEREAFVRGAVKSLCWARDELDAYRTAASMQDEVEAYDRAIFFLRTILNEGDGK